MTIINEATAKRRKSRSGGRTETQMVSDIRVGDRLRDVGDVTSLAASMDRVGLETPITVRIDLTDPEKPGFPILVTGARRLAAAKALGWESIECFIHVNMTDDEAKALEITENLEREDLTGAERKKWVKALAAAFERMDAAAKPEKDFPVSNKGGRGKKGVASKVAEATGMTKQRVNQILAEDKKPATPSIPGHTSSEGNVVELFTDAASAPTPADTKRSNVPNVNLRALVSRDSYTLADFREQQAVKAAKAERQTASAMKAAKLGDQASATIEADTKAIMEWLKSRGIADASETQARFTAMLYRSSRAPHVSIDISANTAG